MPVAKRKISISLDADLVAALEAAEESLSAQINRTLRSALERRRRRLELLELLDRLDAEQGPVEEALIEKYIGLMS